MSQEYLLNLPRLGLGEIIIEDSIKVFAATALSPLSLTVLHYTPPLTDPKPHPELIFSHITNPPDLPRYQTSVNDVYLGIASLCTCNFSLLNSNSISQFSFIIFSNITR